MCLRRFLVSAHLAGLGLPLEMSRFESFVLILDRGEKGVKGQGIQERLKTLGEAHHT